MELDVLFVSGDSQMDANRGAENCFSLADTTLSLSQMASQTKDGASFKSYQGNAWADGPDVPRKHWMGGKSYTRRTAETWLRNRPNNGSHSPCEAWSGTNTWLENILTQS